LKANSSYCSQWCTFEQEFDYVANQTNTQVSELYLVCPIPHPRSTSDPPNYEEKFNEVYNELNTNTTFKTILNIEVVPDFTLSIQSDSNVG